MDTIILTLIGLAVFLALLPGLVGTLLNHKHELAVWLATIAVFVHTVFYLGLLIGLEFGGARNWIEGLQAYASKAQAYERLWVSGILWTATLVWASTALERKPKPTRPGN